MFQQNTMLVARQTSELRPADLSSGFLHAYRDSIFDFLRQRRGLLPEGAFAVLNGTRGGGGGGKVIWKIFSAKHTKVFRGGIELSGSMYT